MIGTTPDGLYLYHDAPVTVESTRRVNWSDRDHNESRPHWPHGGYNARQAQGPQISPRVLALAFGPGCSGGHGPAQLCCDSNSRQDRYGRGFAVRSLASSLSEGISVWMLSATYPHTRIGGGNMNTELRLLRITLVMLAVSTLAASMLCDPASAFARWAWQNPIPCANALRDVACVDSSRVWAVGDFGTILSTTDGGAKWVAQSVGTTESLRAVSFVDANRGWVLAGDGAIFSTVDGGTTWSAQSSEATQPMFDIVFTDAEHGWAVGWRTILATTDGGRRWIPQSLPAGAFGVLSRAAFADSDRGWVVGWLGEVLSTTDGGAHWIRQPAITLPPPDPGMPPNVNPGLNDVTCLDSLHVWSLGHGGQPQRSWLFATSDGGAHWTTQSLGADRSFYGAAFTDEKRGFVVGAQGQAFGGTIFGTSDSGAHWAQVASADAPLLAVSFSDSLHGWAVGQYGVIMATKDGGANWVRQTGETVDFNDVQFADPEHGWAVGRNGAIFATTNGGASWEPQSSGTTLALEAASFVDERHGWAVGIDGVVLRTADGGAHWESQRSGPGFLWSVDFVDRSHGWAVGERRWVEAERDFFSTVLTTVDGGSSWTTRTVGTKEWLTDVMFVDSSHGWVVGQSGTILATVDGGVTWVPQVSTTTQNLWSVSFVDSLYGWVVGDAGTILTTSDGGEHWTSQLSGKTVGLRDVGFADLAHGLAVGSDGMVLKTVDGGGHWVQQDCGAVDLYGVAFPDPARAWAAGSGGAILGTVSDVEIARSPALASVVVTRRKGKGALKLGAVLSTVDGMPVGSAAIELQASANGKTRWKTVRSLVTNRAGATSALLTFKRSGTAYYRWRTQPNASLGGVIGKKQQVIVR